MEIDRIVAAVLLPLAGVGAQVTLDVRAASDCVVTLTDCTQSLQKSIKKDTVIDKPLGLDLYGQRIDFTPSNAAGRVRYSCAMRVIGDRCKIGDASGKVLIWIKSRMTLRGTLTLRYRYSETGHPAPCFCQHVIISSVAPDLHLGVTNVTKSYGVTLDAAGIWVGHGGSLSASASTPNSGTATISIEFEPDAYLAPYGTGCGPALSAGHDIANRIVLTGSRLANKATWSGIIVGLRPLSAPVPGTGCFVLTDPLVVFPWSVSNGGTAGVSFPRPPGTSTTYVQAIEMPSVGMFRSSNGVLVELR